MLHLSGHVTGYVFANKEKLGDVRMMFWTICFEDSVLLIEKTVDCTQVLLTIHVCIKRMLQGYVIMKITIKITGTSVFCNTMERIKNRRRFLLISYKTEAGSLYCNKYCPQSLVALDKKAEMLSQVASQYWNLSHNSTFSTLCVLAILTES